MKKNIDKLVSDMDKIEAQIWENLKKDVNISAHYTKNIAKRLCPVDEGTLRASIDVYYDQNPYVAMMGSLIHYAPYVELGTSKMRAQPFLRPAIRKGILKLRKLTKKTIDKTMNEIL